MGVDLPLSSAVCFLRQKLFKLKFKHSRILSPELQTRGLDCGGKVCTSVPTYVQLCLLTHLVPPRPPSHVLVISLPIPAQLRTDKTKFNRLLVENLS